MIASFIRKVAFRLLLTVALAIFTFSFAGAKILMKPYLQAVTDSSVIVMIETDSKSDVTVKYGLTEDLEKRAETFFYVETERRNPTFVHRVKLRGLKAGTRYYYQAGFRNEKTEVDSFKTAVKPGEEFTFAIMGDNRSNPDIFSGVCEEMNKHKPDFSLYIGDLCYNSEYSSWKKEFLIEENLALCASAPFFNAVGNHEDWAQNTKAFTQSLSEGETNLPFYTFDYGDAHFVIISSESSFSKHGKQYKSIKESLENTDKSWKIAAVHIPAYSAGGHGGNAVVKKFTEDVLEPNGVQVVYSGHSHFYQHNYIEPIHHFIIAGGGAPLYSPEKEDFVVKSAKKYHYAICKVSAKSFNMKVYDIHGEIIEEFALTKWK